MPKATGAPRKKIKRLKAKGDGYERELAAFFNHHLFAGKPKVARSPLSGGGGSFFTGAGGYADLTGLPFIWTEAKRTERLRLYDALAQAERSIRGKRSPDMMAIMSRRSRWTTGESIVTMRLADWLPLYRAFLSERGIAISVPDEPAPAPTEQATDQVPPPDPVTSDDPRQIDLEDYLK